jgi:transcription elongation factor Elf1
MRCPSCGKKLAEEVSIMGASRLVIVCRHCHTRVEVLDKNRIIATK